MIEVKITNFFSYIFFLLRLTFVRFGLVQEFTPLTLRWPAPTHFKNWDWTYNILDSSFKSSVEKWRKYKVKLSVN